MALKKLHPGAKWSFRIQSFFGGIFFILIFFGWIIPLVISIGSFSLQKTAGYIIIALISLIILIEIYTRLSYHFWGYEFAQDQLRIERGIIWKKYSNIPYQRMQNVDITRGIIARICGFSTVNIQTAGYSMGPNSHGIFSEGHIPAVSIEEAEKIREFVIKKITHKKGSGL